MQNGKKLSSISINYEPSCVSIHQATGDVAVGSTSDNKVNIVHIANIILALCYYQSILFTVQVYIYELSDTTLTLKTELEHLGPVTDASYSPDNEYLVVCDGNRKVVLYALPEYKV